VTAPWCCCLLCTARAEGSRGPPPSPPPWPSRRGSPAATAAAPSTGCRPAAGLCSARSRGSRSSFGTSSNLVFLLIVILVSSIGWLWAAGLGSASFSASSPGSPGALGSPADPERVPGPRPGMLGPKARCRRPRGVKRAESRAPSFLLAHRERLTARKRISAALRAGQGAIRWGLDEGPIGRPEDGD
jgi:hypothetical protein